MEQVKKELTAQEFNSKFELSGLQVGDTISGEGVAELIERGFIETLHAEVDGDIYQSVSASDLGGEKDLFAIMVNGNTRKVYFHSLPSRSEERVPVAFVYFASNI